MYIQLCIYIYTYVSLYNYMYTLLLHLCILINIKICIYIYIIQNHKIERKGSCWIEAYLSTTDVLRLPRQIRSAWLPTSAGLPQRLHQFALLRQSFNAFPQMRSNHLEHDGRVENNEQIYIITRLSLTNNSHPWHFARPQITPHFWRFQMLTYFYTI